MLKSIRNTLAASVAALAFALPVQANVFFNAQFTERGGAGDTDLDQFFFNLSQTGSALYDVSLTALTVTFDTGIFVDLGIGPTVQPAGVDAVDNVVTAPGANFFGLAFTGFDIGDALLFNIDLDDEDSVVRGTGGGLGADFAGSTVEVFYVDAGVDRFMEFSFGACDPAVPDTCSAAGGQLQIPAPMSIALLGLGLLGMAASRRSRGSSAKHLSGNTSS